MGYFIAAGFLFVHPVNSMDNDLLLRHEKQKLEPCIFIGLRFAGKDLIEWFKAIKKFIHDSRA